MNTPGGETFRSAIARRSVRALLAVLLATFLSPDRGAAGVRLGDAVPGVIKGSDLERIKRRLDLERFSVIAAVWLGAGEGREAIVVEPLAEKPLALVKEGCAKGAYCPDRFGFVASRVRIVLLQGDEVLPVLVVDREARGPTGRLFSMNEIGERGAPFGWSGWAEAADGHVALVLTPIVEGPNGRARAGSDAPFRVRWNEGAGRFQLFECTADGEAGTTCAFRDETGD